MIDASRDDYNPSTFIEAAVLEYVERVRRRRAIFAQMVEAARAQDDDLSRTLSYQYEIENLRGDLAGLVAWLMAHMTVPPGKEHLDHYMSSDALPEIIEALRDDEYLGDMIEGLANRRNINITFDPEGTPE